MENTSKALFTYNEAKHEIIATRIFDAPRELLFQVLLDPSLVPNWWGPRSLTTRVDQMDVRPGGTWRYVQHDADGNEFAFHGVYQEISPSERIVSTFEFEGMPGHELLEVMTIEALGNQSKLTVVDTFQSLEDMQGMVASGMEQGATESYDRLEELLQEQHSA